MRSPETPDPVQVCYNFINACVHYIAGVLNCRKILCRYGNSGLTQNPSKQSNRQYKMEVDDHAAGVDTDLYSRQIGTLGFEMMRKLQKLKVLIIGMKGAGVEIGRQNARE